MRLSWKWLRRLVGYYEMQDLRDSYREEVFALKVKLRQANTEIIATEYDFRMYRTRAGSLLIEWKANAEYEASRQLNKQEGVMAVKWPATSLIARTEAFLSKHPED